MHHTDDDRPIATADRRASRADRDVARVTDFAGGDDIQQTDMRRPGRSRVAGQLAAGAGEPSRFRQAGPPDSGQNDVQNRISAFCRLPGWHRTERFILGRSLAFPE